MQDEPIQQGKQLLPVLDKPVNRDVKYNQSRSQPHGGADAHRAGKLAGPNPCQAEEATRREALMRKLRVQP